MEDIKIGVKYIIKLNKSIDNYDIFLPICILVREMLILDNIENTITIIDNNLLKERFNKMEYYKEYVENIKTGLDLKWIDVYNYSSKIKFSDEIHDEDKIADYFKKIADLDKKYNGKIKDDNDFRSYKIMKEVIDLNEILQHENYLNIIKDLESQLTNIELSGDELNLINKIVDSPLLDGLIKNHGFQLVIY